MFTGDVTLTKATTNTGPEEDRRCRVCSCRRTKQRKQQYEMRRTRGSDAGSETIVCIFDNLLRKVIDGYSRRTDGTNTQDKSELSSLPCLSFSLSLSLPRPLPPYF